MTDTPPHQKRDIESSSQRHSRRVRQLRIVLPVTAGLLMVVIFLLIRPNTSNTPISFENAALTNQGVVIQNPVFSDSSENGEPFDLSAASAREDLANPGWVYLDTIRASMTSRENVLIELIAPEGNMLRAQKKLVLSEKILKGNTFPVSLITSNGYHLDMRDLNVDFEKRSAHTDNEVIGKGPIGRFRADKMVLKPDAHLISFIGDVTIRVTTQNKGTRNE